MTFVPAGRWLCPSGDEVIAPITRVASRFAHIVLTQDWHPTNHTSFAASHAGKKPYESIELAYGAQTLWPAHCVQGTPGADFHPGLYLATSRVDSA